MKRDINDTLREEGPDAARARHDQARKYQANGGSDKPRFELVSFDQIKLQTEGLYLIKGLIPATGLVVIWGPKKCGKSFWTFDTVLHIALGWKYRGRRVRQGSIVYCAMEGASGYGARKEAWFRRHSPGNNVPFYLISSPMKLVADHATLISDIKSQLGNTHPAAIVLDTLNRSINGSESDDRDMALYIAAADAIRDAFGCAVIVIHHCGVDSTRPRGHTSLTAAADAQLSVKRDPAGNVEVTVEWMKDGPEGDSITSRLEQVEVGVDEDGEPITSCVVVPVDQALVKSSSSRWPKALVFYHRALCEALATFGKNSLPFDLDGPALRTVNREHIRDEFKRIYPVDGDSDAKKGDALKQAFKRAEKDAITRNLVGCRETGGAMLFWLMSS